MSGDIIVALDQGSSSSRALAFDSRGRVVARAQRPLKTSRPRAGFAEHDALEIARSQERAMDETLRRLPKSCRVLGLGMACQRSTVVFWDKKTGKPAAAAPSWQDGRASGMVAALQDHQAQAHKTTGLYLTPYYSAPKIRWCIDHVPAVRRLLDAGRLMVGPVSTWLVWNLTRGEVFAVDPSMAQRMMLMSLHTLDWDPDMLALFGLPPGILPRIIASVGDWGVCAAGGRKIPILATLGDQQAAAVGLGAVAAGSSVASYGTGAFFLHHVGTSPRRIPGLLTSMGWNARGRPANFFVEGTVHAAGSAFDWLRGNLGLLKNSSSIDALCRASQERLLVLPAIGGLGAPRWDYETRTAFFGLTARSSPADIVRGVAEGVAFLISDIVEAMRAAGLSPASASVCGGLSRCDYLMQFQADILGVCLERRRETEGAALGAAQLAAQAVGADWAVRLQTPKVDKIFKPKMPRAEAKKLLEVWTRFVAAQAALSREVRTLLDV